MWFHLFIYGTGEGANSCTGCLTASGLIMGYESYKMYSYISIHQQIECNSAKPIQQTLLFWQCAFMWADTGFHESSHTINVHMNNSICAVVAAIREGEIVFLQHRNLWCLYCGVLQKSELKLEAVTAEKHICPCVLYPVHMIVGGGLGVGVCLENINCIKIRLFTYLAIQSLNGSILRSDINRKSSQVLRTKW